MNSPWRLGLLPYAILSAILVDSSAIEKDTAPAAVAYQSAAIGHALVLLTTQREICAIAWSFSAAARTNIVVGGTPWTILRSGQWILENGCLYSQRAT